MKFITQKMHALIDYPVALSLFTLPFLLGLGESNILAFYLSVITGAAAFILTLLTNHESGIIKIISYEFHLLVDLSVGISFLVLPLFLGFQGLDLLYYIANGLAVLTVVGLHKGETKPKTVFA